MKLMVPWSNNTTASALVSMLYTVDSKSAAVISLRFSFSNFWADVLSHTKKSADKKRNLNMLQALSIDKKSHGPINQIGAETKYIKMSRNQSAGNYLVA